ncbi:uncharacterized protein LOC123707548 isoform X1 [Pieris brassicae]|uniref:Borealin C-terminal domain-containing protein n=1 Tax=Pieris brassicae TaxID=7116 RepID=A0A9P0T6V1_PIEBR|nr:uncharacterized protein LOC123707548 isoform X1 [Pieris brassicae]CAH4023593.1 unnamed protein product [Pieris brassicae]
MPRTKRPVKKQEKVVDSDDTLKRIKKLSNDLKAKIDSQAQMQIGSIEIAFKILLGSISATNLQKTLGQLKNELLLKEPTNTRQSRVTASSRAASNDDGYLTENSSQGSGDHGAKKTFMPPSATRSIRRSRSADASAHSVARPSKRATTQRRRSKSVYRTPAYNRSAAVNYPVITPKVTPHTPLTLLRQPRQGEMVVSMSGSPVMVPSCAYAMQPDEKANCNILLRDGTMLSLQPKQLRQSQAYIPFSLMDDNVLPQIKTLKDNLDKFLKLGERAMK